MLQNPEMKKKDEKPTHGEILPIRGTTFHRSTRNGRHPHRPQRHVKLDGGRGQGRNNLSPQLRPDASFERLRRFVSARRPSINSIPTAANSTDIQNTG